MNEQPTDGRRWQVIASERWGHDPDGWCEAGRYATLEAARAAGERVVRESLAHCAGQIHELTAEALLAEWVECGDNALIHDTMTGEVERYAEQLAERMAPEVCAVELKGRAS